MRIRLGGLVMARSVKFLGKLEATLSDQETREGWWEELRDEIKSHARTVCCTHVIGYTETCTIFGDVCLLSAVGTAAVVKYLGYPTALMTSPSDLRASPLLFNQPPIGTRRSSKGSDNDENEDEEDEDEEDENIEDEYDDEEEEEELELDEFGSGMKIRKNGNPNANQNGRKNGNGRNILPHMGLARNVPKTPKGPFQGTFQGSKSPNASEKSSGKTVSAVSLSDSTPSHSHSHSHGGSHNHGSSHGNNHSNVNSNSNSNMGGRQDRARRVQRPCSYVHVPYNHNNAPFSFMRLVPCLACRRKWVPETILATIEPSFTWKASSFSFALVQPVRSLPLKMAVKPFSGFESGPAANIRLPTRLIKIAIRMNLNLSGSEPKRGTLALSQ